MTSEWQDNRADYHVPIIFGGIMVLSWLVVFVSMREKLMMEPDIWWHVKTGEWM